MCISVATSFRLECYVFVIILILLRNNLLESVYCILNIYFWGHGTISRAKSTTKACSLFLDSNGLKSRKIKPKVNMSFEQGSEGKKNYPIAMMIKWPLNL